MRVSPFSLVSLRRMRQGAVCPPPTSPRVFFIVVWASPSLRLADAQEKTAGLSPAVMFQKLNIYFQILKPSRRGVDGV